MGEFKVPTTLLGHGVAPSWVCDPPSRRALNQFQKSNRGTSAEREETTMGTSRSSPSSRAPIGLRTATAPPKTHPCQGEGASSAAPGSPLLPDRCTSPQTSAIAAMARDLRASGAEGDRFGVKAPEFTSGVEGALRKPPGEKPARPRPALALDRGLARARDPGGSLVCACRAAPWGLWNGCQRAARAGG